MYFCDIKTTIIYLCLIALIALLVYAFNRDLTDLKNKYRVSERDLLRKIIMANECSEYLDTRVDSLESEVIDLKIELKELKEKKPKPRKAKATISYATRKEEL